MSKSKNGKEMKLFSFKSKTLEVPLADFCRENRQTKSEALRRLVDVGLRCHSEETGGGRVVAKERIRTYTDHDKALSHLSAAVTALVRLENAVRRLNTELYSRKQKSATLLELEDQSSAFADLYVAVKSKVVAAFAYIPSEVVQFVLERNDDEWRRNDPAVCFLRQQLVTEVKK